MLIIGAAGPIGSGKDTFSTYLKEKHRAFVTSMGDAVRAEAEALGIEENRENLQKLGVERRRQFGGDYWARKVAQHVADSNAELAVINGVRTVEDAEVPKGIFGEKFRLVFLECPADLRFERLRKRGRAGDPETFEEFRQQERAEWEKFRFEDTLKLADFTIKNDSSVEEFFSRIDNLLKQLKHKP